MIELTQSILCCKEMVRLFDDSETVPSHDKYFSFDKEEEVAREILREEKVLTGECRLCKKQFDLRIDLESAVAIPKDDLIKSCSSVEESCSSVEKSCEQCESAEFAPSHDGSRMCRSGSIASGGDRKHCACNACF